MGIPGLRGGDHIGITVPDMGQAHEFLVERARLRVRVRAA